MPGLLEQFLAQGLEGQRLSPQALGMQQMLDLQGAGGPPRMPGQAGGDEDAYIRMLMQAAIEAQQAGATNMLGANRAMQMIPEIEQTGQFLQQAPSSIYEQMQMLEQGGMGGKGGVGGGKR